MSDDATLELAVSEDAAKAAIRRDEMDTPGLFEKLDSLIWVYEILDERATPQTTEDLQEIRLLLEEDLAVGVPKAARTLSDFGVVEDTGQ